MTTAELMALANDPAVPPANRDAIRRQLTPEGSPQSKPTAPARTEGRPAGANKLEQAYARHLDVLKAAGEVEWWAFNAVRLCIAFGEKRAWFKPDFAVKFKDGRVEMHETKGFMREAAALRIKVAAGLYPFAFIVVRRVKGEWVYERFGKEG